MKMKYLILGFCLTLMGCESSQDMFRASSNAPSALNDGYSDEADIAKLGIRCEMLSRTGSNRKTKVCRTAEQRDSDADVAERTIERLQKNGGTISK
jgi:hypothetical protein